MYCVCVCVCVCDYIYILTVLSLGLRPPPRAGPPQAQQVFYIIMHLKYMHTNFYVIMHTKIYYQVEPPSWAVRMRL